MSLSRRQFLRGGQCHIASLMVQCLPENLSSVEQSISTLEGVEVPQTDSAGKLIVLLEVDTEYQLLERTQQIEHITGVIGATMVYHQIGESQ